MQRGKRYNSNSKNKICYGSVPKVDKEYERKLTYCKRFHLLHSKHGTGNEGKERKYRVSVCMQQEARPSSKSRALSSISPACPDLIMVANVVPIQHAQWPS